MGLWASVAEQLRAEPRLSSSPAAAMLDREVVQCSPHLRQWRLRITPSTQFRTVLFYVHSSQHFHFLMIGPTRHIYSIPTSFSSSSLSRVIALSASKAARGGASGGGCGRGRPRPSPILLPHPPPPCPHLLYPLVGPPPPPPPPTTTTTTSTTPRRWRLTPPGTARQGRRRRRTRRGPSSTTALTHLRGWSSTTRSR